MILKHTPENRIARAAFTLMEMLVVVAIIVALAGLGGYYVMGQLASSQKKTAKLKAIELNKAVETYMLDHNQNLPGSLEMLLGQDDHGGPYLKSKDSLVDPWGAPYRYDPSGPRHQGREPDIWSVGPKGNEELGNF